MLNRSRTLALATLSLLTSVIISCGGEKGFISEKELTLEEKIEKVNNHLEDWITREKKDSAVVDGYYLQAYAGLYRMYDTVGFQTIWLKNLEPSPLCNEFMTFLGKTPRYGLDSNLYYINDIRYLLDSSNHDDNFVSKARNLAMADVLLTHAYLLVSVHLQAGYIDSSSGTQTWKIDSVKNRNIYREFAQLKNGGLITNMLNHQPKNIEYRYLLTALNNYLDTTRIDNRSFNVPELKTDSLACRDSIKVAMLYWHYLDSAYINSDSAQIASFKKFQELHGLDNDGIPGKNSVACVRMSNYQRFMQACLAVEKWKWKKPRNPELMIHVNIPAFKLHAIRNDSLIRKHRVVTGLPDKQTPQFSAKMKWVTLFPYWNVPHSISTEEIAPHLRRSDTAYLNKHGYEMFGLNKELADLSTVKWKKLSKDYFPYRLRQKGGPTNSLGLIQFHFPNKHDVYLHDTPAKYFFRKNTRAFSHGCIRLQDPFNFGTFILQQDRKKDTINIDTVMAWIGKKEEQRIYLKKYIRVEIDYISVTGDSLGNITFHFDIYNRDPRFISKMYPCKSPVQDKLFRKKQSKPTKQSAREEKKTVWLRNKRFYPMRA